MSKRDGVSQADVINAYKQAFATPEAQVVLGDLMRRFGFTRSSTFTPQTPFRKETRPEDTIYYEGQRSVLVHIGMMMDADPSTIIEPEETKSAEG